MCIIYLFFFKQKTAYEMRISDWSSDVCSSDLPNVTEAVEAAKGGQIEFRVEKAGIIHAGLGKASFSEADLKKNFEAFLDAIVKAKPSGSKGNYVRKVALSSSMGPGVKIDVAELSDRKSTRLNSSH